MIFKTCVILLWNLIAMSKDIYHLVIFEGSCTLLLDFVLAWCHFSAQYIVRAPALQLGSWHWKT